MKKRTITLIIVLTLLVSLLTVATVAASSSNVGYENFKESLSQVKHSDSGSGEVKVIITDNDVVQLDAAINMVADKESNQFSGNVALTTISQSKNFQISGDDGSAYLIDVTDQKYYTWLMEKDMSEDYDGKHWDDKGNYEDASGHDGMMDFIVGDLKDNFSTLTETDGSQRLQFNMTTEDVPTSLSLFINLGAKHQELSEDDVSQEPMKMEEMDLPFLEGFDFKNQFANTLVSDIKILAVDVEILVNSNHQVTAFNTLLSLDGLDDQGNYHKIDVVVAATMNTEQLDEVQMIDTTQYDWEVITMDHSKRHHGFDINEE